MAEGLPLLPGRRVAVIAVLAWRVECRIAVMPVRSGLRDWAGFATTGSPMGKIR
ncbi:MAG: hypothetical protein ACRDPY_31285 [Streptosporangiaceae bacterium]